MDVRIGVLHCPKELTLEVDTDAAALEKLVNDALTPTAGCSGSPTSTAGGSGCPPSGSPMSSWLDDAAVKRVGFGPG